MQRVTEPRPNSRIRRQKYRCVMVLGAPAYFI